MVKPLLAAEGLRRQYGARTIVAVDSLELTSGEVLAVVGPNGAGKSTLFRLLLMLEQADAGVLRLGGAVIRSQRELRGRVVGVFQRPILFSGTVRDNVGYGVTLRHRDRRAAAARVAAALEWLGLEQHADRRVHELSGGEAQRVALARALVLEPDVLILDEPSASLDVSVRRRFRSDLDRVARQHARGIILITHDMDEACGLADRVAVMHHGRLVQSGTPEDLVRYPATPFIAELAGAEPPLAGMIERVRDGLWAVRVSPELLLWATPAGAAGAPGDAVLLSYRADQVRLAGAADGRAVNRVPGVVESIRPSTGLVHLRLRVAREPAVSISVITTHAVLDAGCVEPGTVVHAELDASAVHAWCSGYLRGDRA